MEDKMTIGEFAKLKNTTQETLRHYEKIGLLSPVSVNPVTGYRYYSIFQYEKLSTILELRQLGMSLADIKKFFEERNVENALELLEGRHETLLEEIETLVRLEKKISHKIRHLKHYSDFQNLNDFEIKTFPNRKILIWEKDLSNHVADYGYVLLERYIKDIAPIFAENRYGMKISEETSEGKHMFLLIEDETEISKEYLSELQMIKGGEYACMFFRENEEKIDGYLEETLRELKKRGMERQGDIVMIAQLDLSVVGNIDQILYEIQIPIKKD